MFTFLYDIAKPLAEQNAFAAFLTDKDDPQATRCKPIYLGKPVICNFCSHSAKPTWRLQTKWYGKLRSNVVQGAAEVETELLFFVSVEFLLHSEQWANTSMADVWHVKLFFSFWGQRKVLSCEILPSRTPTLFLSRRSASPFLNATKSAAVLQNFQVNLHFTHYAQGKYDIERKFMYL